MSGDLAACMPVSSNLAPVHDHITSTVGVHLVLDRDSSQENSHIRKAQAVEFPPREAVKDYRLGLVVDTEAVR